MHALVLDRQAEPHELHDALRACEVPDPEPGPGEVRVRVEAGALNPTDYQRAQYGVTEWTWPAILGLDVVGVVDRLGPGVDAVQVGQRVAYVGDIRRPGAFAEFTIADVDAVAVVPEGLDPVDAAALPSAGLTAYQSIVRRLRVDDGDVVLVTGGAGGVGGFATQLASVAGARVLVTEHPDNAAAVESLGAEALIDFRGDVAGEVMRLTGGRGVDAVLDTIGAESATANMGLLAFGGRLAAVAGRPDLSQVPQFRLAPTLHEIALGAAYMAPDRRPRQDLAAMMAALMELAADGRVSSMVSRVISLSEVPSALVELANRKVSGKIVQRPV